MQRRAIKRLQDGLRTLLNTKVSGASRSQARDDSGRDDADQLIPTKQIKFSPEMKRGIVAMHVGAMLKPDDIFNPGLVGMERMVVVVKRPDLVGWLRAR
ncbi:hypothetical protein N7494_006490 [Penicillium frequentans]|uniref:Uncharacterized protein n=1 Tax=Penicillium frequentans TaxID=3151616 RepID=A0AAD6CWQ4_9EURO|nr:hypothetical protein N7494_006490 [Penicillium glabrum]